MAVLFWYIVKRDLSSVRYTSITFYKVRGTHGHVCITGHPVQTVYYRGKPTLDVINFGHLYTDLSIKGRDSKLAETDYLNLGPPKAEQLGHSDSVPVVE